MIVSGKACEKRGSRWASRSSKEAERAASLDFILEVSAVISQSTGRRTKADPDSTFEVNNDQ